MKNAILLTCFAFSLSACGDASELNTHTVTTATAKANSESTSTISLHVQGMTCKSCENAIKRTLKGRDGVVSVEASHSKESVVVSFDSSKISSSDIKEAIIKLGYEVT